MRPDCAACCFYRLVDGKRRLCQLTGARRPMAGGAGCQFVSVRWEQLDQILGLPTAGVCGNSGVPNQMKPGNGFSRNGEIVARTKIALDDFRLNADSHISEKLRRRFTDPVPARAGGSFDRGICESPFHV